MSWFSFSLLSIVALATAELLQQYLMSKKGKFDEMSSTSLTFLVLGLITLPIILLTDLKKQFFDVLAPDVFPYLVLVTFFGTFSMIYYLKSFKVKNISISTIFISLSVAISTLLGVIFFNESLYFYKLLGIGLILLAIISLNYKNLSLENNHKYGLIAGMLFGVMYTLDKKIVLDTHPLIYVFWSFTLVSLLGFLLRPKAIFDQIRKTKLVEYKPLIFSGFGYFLYNFFTFSAYKAGGEVGRVDAINNSQVFIIILVEYFLFKHTQGIARKLITAAVAFSGVAILGTL